MTCRQCTAHRKWQKAIYLDLKGMAERWERALSSYGPEGCARELRDLLATMDKPKPTSWQAKLRRKAEEP